tara:strand:- start:867 stop:1940 length:1074 start_codon:yes stop_codon:yes gene_type:complete
MDIQTKLDLCKQVGEEILTEEELKTLLETKKNPIAYDGFEPSGNPHIAQGIIRSININKLTKAGFRFKMLVADWHAWANDKLDGDLDKIQTVGKYLIELWKVTGMNLDKVDFIWANDLMQEPKYLKKVMKVATNTTIKRAIRCSQIMGRSESSSLKSSQIMYPCMQAADIFHLNVDVCQLGMDQRKVNVLAREVGDKLFGYKPVAIHHHMLMGLGQPPSKLEGMEKAMAMKMSKTDPNSAIFMTDTEKEIIKKINKAHCPEGIVEENPVMEYAKYIVFEKFKEFNIERPDKFGGNVSFGSYDELVKAYSKKELHPGDLKQGVANKINEVVSPVRKHFEKNKKAKELFEKVQSFKVSK